MQETPENHQEKIARTTEISFQVHLNQDNLPIAIDWDATDSPIEGRKTCKSIMVAMWDEQARQALRMDLWTKEMRVDEMNHFFFQTLMTMSETYQRATGDADISNEIKQFGYQFAKKLNLFPQKS